MMRMQFEMSINAYAYDLQNSDASMYILTQRFWLLVAASGWLQTFSGVNQTAVLRPKPPLDGALVELLSEHPKYLCSAPETYLSVEGAAHSVILTGKP